ncbi:uncharacterized protein LOC118194629 [Stegodyphus dumicola]|uniref:uncharacterized protein LOC118194629 n=1 Tax=Stegodyphus dumicola TaxID=202533 RepID=UPI0015ADBAC6|nr:uncharacterized protein LOC118194629 [Stegodyphus dumicola]
MRNAWIFLLLLFFCDTFFTNFAASLVIHVSYTRMLRFLRTIRFLVRLTTFIRRLAFFRRFLGFVPLLMLRRQDKVGGKLLSFKEDSCFKKLACEIISRPYQNIADLTSARKSDLFQQRLDDAERKLLLSITLSSTEENDLCKKRYSSCPYSSREMLEAMKKFQKMKGELNIPRIVTSDIFKYPKGIS